MEIWDYTRSCEASTAIVLLFWDHSGHCPLQDGKAFQNKREVRRPAEALVYVIPRVYGQETIPLQAHYSETVKGFFKRSVTNH